MLHCEEVGAGDTTLLFLHFLGGSARGWASTTWLLADTFRCVAVDLPGFGGSSDLRGYSVAEMADAVIEVVHARVPQKWMLIGHSLGAKVAAVVARRVEQGETELKGLCGMVLLAGSPPGPEPFPEERRMEMRKWFGDVPETSRSEAETFIQANSGSKLTTLERDRLIGEVLRADRNAWLSWLDVGSREDWSQRVGVLSTPALVVAGADDVDLGPDAQRRFMLPHFANVRFEILAGAKHLLPMECPEKAAILIAAQASRMRFSQHSPATVGTSYQALIDSDRVSARTREVLTERATRDDAACEPVMFTLEEVFTLRAVLDRIIPQNFETAIDLAAGVDRQLQNAGDGWRYAALPPDAEAYRSALLTLEMEAQSVYKRPFGLLSPKDQDALLSKASEGTLGEGAGPYGTLTSEQMRLWFQDLCGDAVRLYVAHPITLERIGYSGFADGSDASTAQGFHQIGIGERESWEPIGKPVEPR